jgi:hypothetical protein
VGGGAGVIDGFDLRVTSAGEIGRFWRNEAAIVIRKSAIVLFPAARRRLRRVNRLFVAEK